jgi:ABC-type multidrug transport system fused ATPase/permease subunit
VVFRELLKNHPIAYIDVRFVQLASVIGALIFFASLQPLTRKIAGSRKGWAEATDGRVQFMSSVLRHVKAIKLSAYERFVIGKAEGLREKELAGYIKFVVQALKVSIATNWLGNFLALVTVITFTVVSLYSDQGGDAVTTAKIFTVITTITLISDPLLMLGQQVGNIIQAWASFKRIEEFLLCAEKQEINVETAITADAKVEDLSIDLTETTFGITGETPLELLKNINVKVQGECLWMITGRVGSGKSLMLQALLGELDVFGGSASVNMGRVGFCCQDPWLRTGGTIRDNILFEQPYDRAWYKEVIKSMALDIDFNTISEGDSTLVGSLSGGQRQR